MATFPELLADEGGLNFLALEILVFIGAFPMGLVADTDGEMLVGSTPFESPSCASQWLALAMVQGVEFAGVFSACLERAVGCAPVRQLVTLMRLSCKCTLRSATKTSQRLSLAVEIRHQISSRHSHGSYPPSPE